MIALGQKQTVATFRSKYSSPPLPHAPVRHLFRVVVERLAFVDDMRGEQLEGSVTQDLETAVLHVAQVHVARAGDQFARILARCLYLRPLDDVEGFHAVMEVELAALAGLDFHD